jgi:hypothetical protein
MKDFWKKKGWLIMVNSIKKSQVEKIIQYVKENDAFDNRKKLINQIIIEEDLTNVNVVDLIICTKFSEEEIDISSREYGNVIIDFINNINNIAYLIALKDRNKIIEYIHNL